MLRSLDWRSLEQRQEETEDSRFSVLSKVRNDHVAIDEESDLKRGTGRREHQYRQLRADRDYTCFSFFPKTVIQWNQLPKSDLPAGVAQHLYDADQENRTPKTQLIQSISSISLSFSILKAGGIPVYRQKQKPYCLCYNVQLVPVIKSPALTYLKYYAVWFYFLLSKLNMTDN